MRHGGKEIRFHFIVPASRPDRGDPSVSIPAQLRDESTSSTARVPIRSGNGRGSVDLEGWPTGLYAIMIGEISYRVK